MNDLIAAVLILLIGVPLITTAYFGFAFIRQARRAARLQAQQRTSRASREAPPR